MPEDKKPPQEDINETQGAGPSTPSGQEDLNTTNPENNSRPWYATPWFWSIIALLCLLILLGWIFWKQWQAHEKLQSSENAKIIEQEARNAEMEARLKALRDALALDPCDVAEFLASQGLLPDGANNTTPDAPKNNQQQDPAPKQENAKMPKTEAEALPPPPRDTDSANTAEASPIANTLELATVLIISESTDGYSTGTGFFIAPGIVLTNAHVIGSPKGNIYVVGKFSEVITKATLRVISNVESRDYAVLQVPITNVTPLKFDTNVARTQKISAWGFPGAVTDADPKFQALINGERKATPEVVYSEGSVSVIQDQNPPIIFHSATVSHGNSGGPLVNEKGNVVGINTYIAMDDESYRQSSLAIVSKDIVAFLKQHNIPFTLGN